MPLNRQPDYENFPEGDFFDRKKGILDRIDSDWEKWSIIEEDDLQYILGKARQFWSLFHYTNELRIEMATDLIEKEIEIEVLKMLLKEAQHGK